MYRTATVPLQLCHEYGSSSLFPMCGVCMCVCVLYSVQNPSSNTAKNERAQGIYIHIEREKAVMQSVDDDAKASLRVSLDYINVRLSTFAIFHFVFTHFLSFVGSFCSFCHCAAHSGAFAVLCVRFIFFLRNSLWFWLLLLCIIISQQFLLRYFSVARGTRRFSLFYSFIFSLPFFASVLRHYFIHLSYMYIVHTARATFNRYALFICYYCWAIVGVLVYVCEVYDVMVLRIEWSSERARTPVVVQRHKKSNSSRIDYYYLKRQHGENEIVDGLVHRSWYSEWYAK